MIFFLYLFLSDAVISIITAILVFRLLPETKPQPREKTENEKSIMGFI